MAIETSAVNPDARYSEPSGEKVVTVRVGFATVATLRLGVNVTGLREMPRHVVPVRNLGWVVILPVTKRTGVVVFVPKSRRGLRSVRFIPDSKQRKRKAMQLNRWVTFVRL